MIDKIIKFTSYAVFALTVVLALFFFFNDAPKLGDELAKIENLSSLEKQSAVSDIAINWDATFLDFAIVLLVVCVGLVVLFFVYKFVSTIIAEPKSAIKSLVSFAAIILVVIVAYLLASDSIPVFLGADRLSITPRMSKWIDTGLYTTYIVFGLAIVMTIYAEISKIWK